jgi:hypothetical protein
MKYNAIGDVTATFKISGDLVLGDIVTMAENDTVKKAEADNEIVGVCVSLNGAYAGIQVKGGICVPYNDSTLTVGYQQLKAVGDGSVSKGTTGTFHLVVNADTVSKTATIIL